LRSAAGACACVGGVGGYFFNDKGSLGHYNVRVSDPVVDGRDVALYTTSRKRPDDNKGTAVNLTQGDELGWASPTEATQQTGMTFSALLTVTPSCWQRDHERTDQRRCDPVRLTYVHLRLRAMTSA